jgi:glutaredoxin 3
MKNVTMYCTATCPFCRKAEKLLKQNSAHVSKIRVDGSQKNLKQMIKHSHKNTVPQIFIGDQYIGGFDELALLDKKGKLAKLLDS